MNQLTLQATIENIPVVTEFVNDLLGRHSCSARSQMQIDVAIDELFSNIARYAYAPDTGIATVSVEIGGDPLTAEIIFRDSGMPYDPLAREDPDITLSVDSRQIGGLGIYMVKKTMDEMVYEYRDGENILTIRKRL